MFEALHEVLYVSVFRLAGVRTVLEALHEVLYVSVFRLAGVRTVFEALHEVLLCPCISARWSTDCA